MSYSEENSTRVTFQLFDKDMPLLAEAIVAQGTRYKVNALSAYFEKQYVEERKNWEQYHRMEHLASQLLNLDDDAFDHLTDMAKNGVGHR